MLKRGGYNTKAPSWYFRLGSQMGTSDGTDIEVLGTECKNLLTLVGGNGNGNGNGKSPVCSKVSNSTREPMSGFCSRLTVRGEWME